MDEKQLQETVKAIVNSIFSEKEEADRQRMTEEAITKSTATINDLTKALAEQKDLFSDLESKYNEAIAAVEEKEGIVASSDESKKKLEEELSSIKEELEKTKTEFEALKASNEVSVKELDEIKSAMAEIEATKVAEERYTALEEAGVSYKDKEKQIAKIKGMSDEDFASYKEELLAIKEAIVSNKSTASGDGDGDGNGVALANVQKRASAAAAISTELKPKDDIVSKYQKLGEALAAAMKKD